MDVVISSILYLCFIFWLLLFFLNFPIGGQKGQENPQ